MSELQDAVTLARELPFAPSIGDMELEAAIGIEITLAMTAPTAQERAQGFERARALHAQRRAGMVEMLEKKRGLRK